MIGFTIHISPLSLSSRSCFPANTRTWPERAMFDSCMILITICYRNVHSLTLFRGLAMYIHIVRYILYIQPSYMPDRATLLRFGFYHYIWRCVFRYLSTEHHIPSRMGDIPSPCVTIRGSRKRRVGRSCPTSYYAALENSILLAMCAPFGSSEPSDLRSAKYMIMSGRIGGAVRAAYL